MEENPLREYEIVFIARDGTKHSWPLPEHKGAIVYPVGLEPFIQIVQNTDASNQQVLSEWSSEAMKPLSRETK